jgi:hypothetical protein
MRWYLINTPWDLLEWRMLRRVQAVFIYCLITDDVSKDYKSFDDWMTVNNKLGWMWKEAVVSDIHLE